jgi:Ca-activated chloride channel homolog
MVRKAVFCVLCLLGGLFLMAGNASATAFASWYTPPDNSSFAAGTVIDLTGNGNGSGMVGGTGLDLMLVFDRSGSMSGTGITNAKSAAIALINALPVSTTNAGLVSFASSASLDLGLTSMATGKTNLINAVNGLVATGNTATGPGIQTATTELTNNGTAGHAKMEVVLSDGASNVGVNPGTAAGQAWTAGITVHSVGVPGAVAFEMQGIATAGHGIYTSVSDLSSLTALFSGTAGNLVGLDHINVRLPDGTWLNNYAHDGLGNFSIANYAVALGANIFEVDAYDTAGNMASAFLTVNGTSNTVPEPFTMLFLGSALIGVAGLGRRFKK